MSLTHQCPGPGCTRKVPSHMLACRTHWSMVSATTRARVWAEYHAGPGSDSHLAACADAIEEMYSA